MTVDLNEHYGVTISHRDGPKGYVAVGYLFSRKTGERLGIEVRGEGRTRGKAAERAIAQAKEKCPLAPPDDI